MTTRSHDGNAVGGLAPTGCYRRWPQAALRCATVVVVVPDGMGVAALGCSDIQYCNAPTRLVQFVMMTECPGVDTFGIVRLHFIKISPRQMKFFTRLQKFGDAG